MRFNDKIKQFGSVYKIIKGIRQSLYIEDYLINQDGELIIIASVSYRQITYPVIIDMRDINGNDA